MNTEKIGKFIAVKRKEKNMTQKQLATKIGITDRAVSKWERGMGCPDISLLEGLSKVLDISVVELLNGEEMEDPTIIEKDLIKSMNYSNEYTKSKIKNNLNTILTTVIISVSLMLIIFNIINSYLLNISYKITQVTGTEQLVSNVEVLFERVLSDQGKFSDEDYEKIVKHVNDAKQVLNDKTKEYLLKEEYTMKDYYNFQEYYKENIQDFYLNGRQYTEYYILLKYDQNMVDNLLKYQQNFNFLGSVNTNFMSYVYSSYKYNIDLENVNMPLVYIISLYSSEHMLLNDIIEVGDISE